MRSSVARLGAPLDKAKRDERSSFACPSRIHSRYLLPHSFTPSRTLSYFSPPPCHHRSLLARCRCCDIPSHPVDAPSSLFRILRARRNPFAFAAALAAAAPLLARPRPRLNSPSSTPALHIAPHRTAHFDFEHGLIVGLHVAPDTASTLVASASSCNALAPCARLTKSLPSALQQRKLATNPTNFNNKESVLP